ncbi:MAG: peptidoglycan editing factor PgeF [Gammaproteobacteria bacterium]
MNYVAPAHVLAPNVQALTTLRAGGVSAGRYASLNLATHVGDAVQAVTDNRRRLHQTLNLPSEPLWLNQEHGTRVIQAEQTIGKTPAMAITADAAITRQSGHVLVVLTADCLPVVLAARDGSAVAIAHAGWRGLAAGVLDAAFNALAVAAAEVAAWIGPGISAARYEVDSAVRMAFADAPGAEQAFSPSRDAEHWYCDLALLAQARLEALGVVSVQQSGLCTYSDPDRFYSYRRDGETGRMATLVQIEPEAGQT